MTILNDVITFTLTDFNSLSDFAKTSLTAYFGPNTDYPTEFSIRLTAFVVASKVYSKNISAADPVVESIISGLAAADAPTLAAAAPILASLDALLNP